MGKNSPIADFKSKCSTINRFIRTKNGRNMFLISIAVVVVLFFAPLFYGSVGSIFIGCIAAPMTIMVWRKYDNRHAIVPAVCMCVPMILDMLFYWDLYVSVCMLVSIVGVITVAAHPKFNFMRKTDDLLYAYLMAGGVCVCIVVLASLLMLLVNIAWWLLCLFLFFGIVAVFFIIVMSSAAYTATDAKRQARKKQYQREHRDYDKYDFDLFAKDIGIKNEVNQNAKYRAEHTRRPRQNSEDQMFYDIED
ncbi:MAG: hypothetical protein Q4A12_02240 [Eubacteriales bacterium]|nr:hypothetical protein [Eubacteriales bacterium]